MTGVKPLADDMNLFERGTYFVKMKSTRKDLQCYKISLCLTIHDYIDDYAKNGGPGKV